MHWIEQLFQVSPDNGDGSLEALIFIAAIALTVAVVPPLRRRFVSLVTSSLNHIPHRR